MLRRVKTNAVCQARIAVVKGFNAWTLRTGRRTKQGPGCGVPATRPSIVALPRGGRFFLPACLQRGEDGLGLTHLEGARRLDGDMRDLAVLGDQHEALAADAEAPRDQVELEPELP